MVARVRRRFRSLIPSRSISSCSWKRASAILIRCDPTANYQRIEPCKLDERLPIFNCWTRWQYPHGASGDGDCATTLLSGPVCALNVEQCIPWDQVGARDLRAEGQGSLARVTTRASAQAATAATRTQPRAFHARSSQTREAAGAASIGGASGAAEGSAPADAVGEPPKLRHFGARGPPCGRARRYALRSGAWARRCDLFNNAFRLAHAGWAASKAPMTVTASAFLSFKRANPAVKRSPVRKGFGAASPTRPRARLARTSTTVMRVTIARSARARAGATRARPAKWRPGPARVSVRRMPTLAMPATGVSPVVGVGVVRSTATT